MTAARWKLPPPGNLPWPLRDSRDAVTSLERDEYGRLVMRIRHQTLRGITPRQLEWWFRNIGGDIAIGGVTTTRYRAWHPFDHIHWALARPAPGGGAGVGALFHIVEAFGADPAMLIDVVEEVARLDESGITLVNRRAGIELSRLSHDFVAAPEGTDYISCLTVGTALRPLSAILNPVIRRFVFTKAMGHAWLRHNVEEVGLLEHLLPLLDAPRATVPAAA